LVQRTRSDRDRRVVHVSITDQGRELVQNSPEVAHGLLVNGLEPLSERKVKSISEGLEQIVSILEVREELPESVQKLKNSPRTKSRQ
jgi:DNA-binding MarR family transcriptional regulator